MAQLRLMDEEITRKYKTYRSKDGVIRSCSLSSKVAKGSVVGTKRNYFLKKRVVKKFLEV